MDNSIMGMYNKIVNIISKQHNIQVFTNSHED